MADTTQIATEWFENHEFAADFECDLDSLVSRIVEITYEAQELMKPEVFEALKDILRRKLEAISNAHLPV